VVVTVQRSITFPPIKLKRIDEYVLYVARNNASLEELRERGLEIGRGRGDISRFLERLKVVEVVNGVATLTPLGRALVSLRELLGPAVYHALFYQGVPQYRLLIDAVRDAGDIGVEELHIAVNDRLSKISPTAWLNRVAFKTLLQIAEDLGAVKRLNGLYSFSSDPVAKAVFEHYAKHGVRIGQSFYIQRDRVVVRECGREEPPHNLYKVDVDCVVSKIYNMLTSDGR
jgi:hypothetical protein